jgi:eukaryotic-like serine/threonine-protein kinase
MAAPACQDCGAPLRSTVARGLCPRCVVRAALTTESTAAVDELNEAGSARRFGAYELGRELGRGGMGVVYEARQLSLHRIVALKMLLPARLASVEELERFRFEAEGVAALEHPNILPVYEVGTAQGQPYFTMKLADGGSLAEQLQDKRLTAAEAARLLATVSHAVHHAHQRGIQHRDLKPGNILLDAAGRPYVSDFGLAKFRDRDSGLTLSTTVLGSPAYMSPEQASGDARRVTVASDVYSLGAILYESLAGRPPFAGATALETMRQVVEAEPTPLRELVARVDRDLEVICLKCLQKDPAKRYASAEVLARDLERWLAGDPIQARPVSRGERFVRWCRRRPALTASLAALFLALIAGIAGIAVQWRRAEEHSFRSALERYAADMQVASQALANHDVGLARRMIAAQMPAPSQPDFRGFEWRLLAQRGTGTPHADGARRHRHRRGIFARWPIRRVRGHGWLRTFVERLGRHVAQTNLRPRRPLVGPVHAGW